MRQNFHIFVDADACPVVAEIERIASKYSLPVTLLYDTNHILTSEYCETIMVSAGRDSVDLALINRTKRGDVVVRCAVLLVTDTEASTKRSALCATIRSSQRRLRC